MWWKSYLPNSCSSFVYINQPTLASPAERPVDPALQERICRLQQASASGGAVLTQDQAHYAAKVSVAPLGIVCYYVTATRVLAYADWSLAPPPGLRHIRQKVLSAVAKGWTCAVAEQGAGI